MKHKLLIMAGGTGGHVMPALAVAYKLMPKGIEVYWLGSKKGMEAELIKGKGIEFHAIDIQGLRGKGIFGLLLAPFRLIRALVQSMIIIRRIKPHTVMSMGGYVSGPGGIAAWLLRIPLILHEQNAISGLTNRLLAPFATKILTAFPKTFRYSKVIITGNPVRESIVAVGQSKESTFNSTETLKLLIIGGSLGASILNKICPNVVQHIGSEVSLNVWHQTGKKDFAETAKAYETVLPGSKVEPFIEDMAQAYQWADLVIARSGALTVAELAAAAVPSILIPFPHAVDDHQSYNARYLTDADAAILLPQDQLSIDSLSQLIIKLAKRRDSLAEMSQKGHALSKPNATEEVANFCVEESSVRSQ